MMKVERLLWRRYMNSLFIDTSSSNLSLALKKDGKVFSSKLGDPKKIAEEAN